MDDGVQVFQTGGTITTGAASANISIPTLQNGVLPKWVRVSATQSAYIKIGPPTPTAVAGDAMVQPGDAVIMAVGGCTKIAALQVTAAGIVQVSPLEDN